MFILVTLLCLAASQLIAAAPHSSLTTYALKERHIVPRGWKRIGPAPAYQNVNLIISLKQDRFDELERHLYEG
jgi:tripeptidyl-peptidase I